MPEYCSSLFIHLLLKSYTQYTIVAMWMMTIIIIIINNNNNNKSVTKNRKNHRKQRHRPEQQQSILRQCDNYNRKVAQTVQQHVTYEFLWIRRTCDCIQLNVHYILRAVSQQGQAELQDSSPGLGHIFLFPTAQCNKKIDSKYKSNSNLLCRCFNRGKHG